MIAIGCIVNLLVGGVIVLFMCFDHRPWVSPSLVRAALGMISDTFFDFGDVNMEEGHGSLDSHIVFGAVCAVIFGCVYASLWSIIFTAELVRLWVIDHLRPGGNKTA